MINQLFEPANPHRSLWCLTLGGEHEMTAEYRLELFRDRYKQATGVEPVKKYTVGFCRTCNKPLWYSGVEHEHITPRCPGH